MKQVLAIYSHPKYFLLVSATVALLLVSGCQLVIEPPTVDGESIGIAASPETDDNGSEAETDGEAVATSEPQEESTEEPAAAATAEPDEEATEEPAEEPTTQSAESTTETTAESTAAATPEPAEESPTEMEEATVAVAEETPEESTTGETAPSTTPDIPGVEPAKASVNIPSLRVHEEPSQDSPMVAGIEEGDTFPVLGISSDGNWIQLEIPDVPNGSGWVSASFVTLEGDITNIVIIEIAAGSATAEVAPSAETSSAVAEEPAVSASTGGDGPMATVNTRSLRVRSAPTLDSEVITGVREGETYRVLEISADGTWVQLEISRAPQGVGWVSAEFLTIEGASEPPAVAATETDSGAEAETDSEAAADTEPDLTTEAQPEASDDAAESAGEADDSATTEQGENQSEEPVAEVEAGFALVSADLPLRVRSEPTTDVDNKVGNVFDGELYPVLEVSADGLWVRIDVPQLGLDDGGWVSAEYVILELE